MLADVLMSEFSGSVICTLFHGVSQLEMCVCVRLASSVFTGQVLSGVADTAVCLTNREEMRLPEVLRLDEKSNSSGMKVTPLTVYGTCPESGMICLVLFHFILSIFISISLTTLKQEAFIHCTRQWLSTSFAL